MNFSSFFCVVSFMNCDSHDQVNAHKKSRDGVNHPCSFYYGSKNYFLAASSSNFLVMTSA